MDTRGWDRPAPDDHDFDLALLNRYVLLDALCQERAALRRRILAQWGVFQKHQATIARGVFSGDAGPQPP